jgi:hypothetical protein
MAWEDQEFDSTLQIRPARPEFYSHARFDETSLGKAVSEVLIGLQENLIPPTHLKALQAALPYVDEEAGEYGVRFNMLREINQQMAIIKGLRNHVFTPTGSLREGMDFKDAKEVLKANDGMLKTMMAQHDKLVNIDRFQKIESAVHLALDKLDDDQRELFIEELKRLLEEGK